MGRRIAGTLLTLIGLALLVALVSLFYAPIPDAPGILVALGMPGVLLGALAGILSLLTGLALGFRSGRVRRWIGQG